uniref:Uncharacterized protein n=1 Tax=Magallana gigas TaxID=29159 RepID=K1PRQ4_MAGGI
MEMNKTVDDPQGSTEALSETLPQETLSTGTQVEPREAQHAYVFTEAHSMSMEAQHVPTEAHHAPTEEGRLVSTEAQHMPTGVPQPFQELKTKSLGTQNMPPKIDTKAPRLMQTEVACEHIENDSKHKMNKCSMISMMLDHDSDNSDGDDEENNKEMDQASRGLQALSRLCAVSGEIILREEARALSELTIKTVLAEERITLEARRMSKMAIQSAYSAAVVTPLRFSKKPNIFRRLLACCFGCCRRRN